MKARIALFAGLWLMLGSYPAWAGTGHAYIGVEDCVCFGDACTPVTTTDLSLGSPPAEPLQQWTDSNSASARCTFWFPASHVSTGATFTILPHFLKGGNGAEQYWYHAGYSVLPSGTSTVTWGQVTGMEGGLGSNVSCLASSGPFFQKSQCDIADVFTAYNAAAAAPCTYAACAGNPGVLFIGRVSSATVGSGATTAQYPIGWDVYWSIP